MEKLNKLFQVQFDKMCQTTGRLYVSQLSGNQIWDLYLGSFVNDPKFRDPESSEHNCNTCKNQLRRYGNIVAIDENNRVMSIFDVATEDPEYQNTVKVLSEKIKSAGVSDIFVETYDMLNSLPYEVCLRSFSKFKLGIARNTKRYTQEEADKFGVVKPNETRTFHHFALEIPSDYVDKSGKSPEAIQAISKTSGCRFESFCHRTKYIMNIIAKKASIKDICQDNLDKLILLDQHGVVSLPTKEDLNFDFRYEVFYLIESNHTREQVRDWQKEKLIASIKSL